MARQYRLWQSGLSILIVFGYLIVGLPARAAVSLVPFSDIDVGGASSGPNEFRTVNNIVFFIATNAQTGRELWKTDGIRAGTVLVKDMNLGPGSSSLSGLTGVGNKLFFFADNGSTGLALWVSDGSAAGTIFVKDVVPGAQNMYAFPRPIDLNGVLIFGVRYIANSHSYSSLWRSDGTAHLITLLKRRWYYGMLGICRLYSARQTCHAALLRTRPRRSCLGQRARFTAGGDDIRGCYAFPCNVMLSRIIVTGPSF